MVKQFKVILMNLMQIEEYFVNCNNEFAAQCICEGLFPRMRVIDVIECK